jgi:cytosine/uracil/thiamine/allantoin permease
MKKYFIIWLVSLVIFIGLCIKFPLFQTISTIIICLFIAVMSIYITFDEEKHD